MRRWLSRLAVVAAAALVPALATAQQPKATSSAKAPPPKADAGAPTADKDAGATKAGPAASGELPPGHPPVGDGLPPGPPPMDPDDDPEGEDPPPPGHGQASPHGQARPSGQGLFEAPADTATDDASLPPGTIAITIADAKGAPIPGAPVTLGILRNTVAKGESRERLAREADGAGSLRFDGLEVGAGVTYRVSTQKDSATYGVMPFALSDKAGKRVLLHSYEVSSNIDEVLVGAQGVVYLSLREDSMSIEHLFSVFNVGPVSWVPDDVTFALPEGFKAFNKPEQMEDTRVDEVDDKGAALRGTFRPGRHDITFRYQVPLEGTARQTFRIEMPPHVAQMRVMAESSKSMGLEVSGFPAAQKSTNRDGKRIMITEKQVGRSERGLPVLEVTITGLPTPGNARWIAVVLGLGAIAGGVGYALQRRDDKALAPDTRADLLDAQRALLDELVALERAHKSGEVGPKSYARFRAALLEALGRIVTMLDEAPVAVRPGARARAAGAR